jgi:hypothetical protein
MTYQEDKNERRADLERVIKIVEKLAGLDAKFDAFIAEFLKDRVLNQSEIKEIFGRLTLLEREGTTIMREGLATQHSVITKQEEHIQRLDKCSTELEEKYVRLKWIIGSITLIIVPMITGIVSYVLHQLLSL